MTHEDTIAYVKKFNFKPGDILFIRQTDRGTQKQAQTLLEELQNLKFDYEGYSFVMHVVILPPGFDPVKARIAIDADLDALCSP